MGTEAIKFTVMGNPIPQPRVVDDTRKQRKYNLSYMPKFDPAAKKKVNFGLKALVHRPDTPFNCPLEVNITFCFKRPDGHYGRQNGQPYLKPDSPEWHTTKTGDIDNLDKFVLDSLTGANFWTDDKLVCRQRLEKRYTCKLPCTEIEIIPLEEKGLFDE